MLKMVDGTGIIGVDMICPLGISTPQPPNYDRVELEGTGMLVLPNSLDAPLERLELGGKTEQVQTTGKNLFDFEKVVVGLINFTDGSFSNVYYKYFTTDYIAIESGDYIISNNNNVGIQSYALYDINSKAYISGKAGNNKVNTLEKCFIRISFSTKPETDISSDPVSYAKKCDIQLEKGTTATPHEPYTGGKPSPSQEYQQEVKNSGKWNEGTQKYEVDVKVTNAEQNWNKEQTLTLTSDRPITKWDRLVEQGGEIGWLYKSKVYDGFDGKNNRIELGNKVGNVQHFSVYFASTPNSAGNANSYCDKYIGVNISWIKEKFGIFCDWNNGVKFFSAPNEKVTNLKEFKAWLIENPLGLAYETLETEFIPLPQSEQNAIRALKTYYPTTVITVDGGELAPDIKVTYRKEI